MKRNALAILALAALLVLLLAGAGALYTRLTRGNARPGGDAGARCDARAAGGRPDRCTPKG